MLIFSFLDLDDTQDDRESLGLRLESFVVDIREHARLFEREAVLAYHLRDREQFRIVIWRELFARALIERLRLVRGALVDRYMLLARSSTFCGYMLRVFFSVHAGYYDTNFGARAHGAWTARRRVVDRG